MHRRNRKTTRWPIPGTPSRRGKKWQGRIQTSRWTLNHSKQHMAVCGLSLHLGSSESRKTLEQKFIFQIGTLNPHGINEFMHLFSRHHIPTNGVTPLSAYKPKHDPQFLQSHWRRANARNVSFFTLYGG